VSHVVTASRLVLGAGAIAAATDGQTWPAATLITLGAVTDGLDGAVARRLGTSSAFGALFDYFADYVCYIVGGWALARALVGDAASLAGDLAMGLALVTGAIRYARNGARLTGRAPAAGDLPGLGTIFFTFVAVTATFLDAPARLGSTLFPIVFMTSAALFSLLMVSPIRYPKLVAFRGSGPIVLVLLMLMPFIATTAIAGAAVLLGLTFVVVGPAFARREAGRLDQAAETRDERRTGQAPLLP
jgi:phosphatidylserine synthase